MAIITTGSLADFSVQPSDEAYRSVAAADQVDSFAVLAEVAREVPADVFRFAVSAEPRGLAIARLRLDKDFQSFIKRIFHKTSDVYFLTWCWDMGGSPASMYPGTAA